MATRPVLAVQGLKYLLIMAASLYFLAYILLAICRLSYPFELEWMEGGAVDHVRKILAGESLYARPGIAFTPYGYTPLYFYLAAVVSKAVGVGFFPLRLVSFISSLACFVIIFQIVKSETQSHLASFLASALFAATFRISGAWFDLARVDSLFLAFFLASVWLLRFKVSPVSYLMAGVLLSLSFLTKQTAFVMLAPVVVYCLFRHGRSGLFLLGSLVAVIGGSTLVLHHTTQGWYSYYVFQLPAQHPWSPAQVVTFWMKDLMKPLSVALIQVLIYFVWPWAGPRSDQRGFYGALLVGMTAGSFFSRVHMVGYDNVLLPVYAMVSIGFGLGVSRLLQLTGTLSGSVRAPTEALIYAACVIQMGALFYDPFAQIPSRADREAGNHLIERMRAVKGDVFVPFHGYLPELAGKKPNAQAMAMDDVLRDHGKTAVAFQEELNTAVREKRFAAIIIDSNWILRGKVLDSNWFLPELKVHYTNRESLFADESVFFPVTGMRTRPEAVYVPRSELDVDSSK